MIEPEMSKRLSSLINFLLAKVQQISMVAKMLAPIIMLTISLNPVNRTTPLYVPTAIRLIVATTITYGICIKRVGKSNSMMKLYLIRYAIKNVATIIDISNNSTSHFEAYFLDILFRYLTIMIQNTYL